MNNTILTFQDKVNINRGVMGFNPDTGVLTVNPNSAFNKGLIRPFKPVSGDRFSTSPVAGQVNSLPNQFIPQ